MVTVELHRHFEAGLSPEAIARLAVRNRVTEARTRAGVRIDDLDPQDPQSIGGYYRRVAAGFGGPDGTGRFLESFGLPLSVMTSLQDLEEAVFTQLVELAAAGSLHTELRGSPYTYQEHVEASIDDIALALTRGVRRAWAERRVSGTFVLAFSRQKGLPGSDPRVPGGQATPIAALAARLHDPDWPVGLDIAGFPEDRYPPAAFAAALAPAREAGVPITVHAGEQGHPPDHRAAPPASIVEAVERLGARRIGHGTSLEASADARRFVRERTVHVESCPLSNACMGFMPLAAHPLARFLDEGLSVSLSTDDPLMFGPLTVAETFEVVAAAVGLAAGAWRAFAGHAVDAAFVSEARRRHLRARLEAEAPAGS